LSKKQSLTIFESIPDLLKDQYIGITVGGEDSTVSDAEFILAPK